MKTTFLLALSFFLTGFQVKCDLTMNDFKENNRSREINRWLLLGVLTALALAGVFFYGPLRDLAWKTTNFLLDKEGARRYFQAQPHAALYFIGLQTLQVIISPIPGELSGFLGGLVFGWSPGFIYATIGLTVGSLFNVTVGRIFERVFLERFIPRRILDRFEAKARRWGLATVFILFLFPGAPKDMLCYLFGLTRLPIPAFILVSSLARMPGTLVLALEGDKVVEGDWVFFALLTGFGLAVSIPALIYKDRLFRCLGISEESSGSI